MLRDYPGVRRQAVLLLCLLGLHASGHASISLQAMPDEELADVSGAGLAFGFDDFSLRMAPTSYVELLGSAPTPQAAAVGWKRGDARYYGLSMTSGGSQGSSWFNDQCAGSGVECPLGKDASGGYGVTAFASVYDPFVLRVYQYAGYDYQGVWHDATSADDPTVFEFIGPSRTDPWRWAFWGELEVDRGGANADLLQSQTIIYGSPVTLGKQWAGGDNYIDVERKPAILRLLRTANSADPTLGLTYQSALSGDFRFSVAQQPDSPNALHEVPNFQINEGMYFRNVDAFLPLGTLNYQAITFSGISEYAADATPLSQPQQNGNFVIELTRIPNIPAVYNHFYCGAGPGDGNCALDAKGAVANPNPDTHGYVRWGTWDPAQMPLASSTDNGIYFQRANGDVTNLGVSRIEGMTIHHLKITTLGAAPQ
ncbi:hypothetical protein [Isoalcanivorax beigongshangi]|uniref:Uncharacterized protein n=1 Tax=Isoalcanivorax beigongshangi TaxID=3238810 RepID=A0ABV4AJZ2_9GAMM